MIYKHYQWKQRKEDPVWRTTTFLPAQDSAPHATSALALLIALADNLPACDDLRAAIEGLPEVWVYASADQAPESPPGPRPSPVLILTHEAERERAFGALAFLASAYVHAGGSGSASPCPGAALASELPAGHPPLPPCAAAPPAATTGGATPVTLPPALGGSLLRLAEALDRPPILDYASCVLLNTVGPPQLEPEDVTIRRTFTGTGSERWFYAVHVAIEAHGARALASIATARAAQAGGGTPDAAVLAGLRSVRDALRAAGATLKRMPERCNDAEFYSVVRPFLQGWPAGGVVYAAEGSAQTHQGASGAQSSLLPAVDAWLGVRHARKASVALRRSMPDAHRRCLVELEAAPSVRAFIVGLEAGRGAELRSAYNEAIREMLGFRSLHAGFAALYIRVAAQRAARKAGVVETEVVGTGGTDFTAFLREYADETRAVLFEGVERVRCRPPGGGLSLCGLGLQLPWLKVGVVVMVGLVVDLWWFYTWRSDLGGRSG